MSSAFASPRSLALRAFRASRRSFVLATLGLTLAGGSRLAAQNPGDLDTSFLSAATGFNVYTQFIEQVGGSPYIVVGGNFSGLDFLLGANGEINATTASTFTFPVFGLPSGRIIYTAVPEVVAPAGGGTEPNILVGGLFGRGSFQIQAKESPQNIKRLSSVGALDTTFNPGGKGANGYVTSITPLADGTILVAGAFDQYNGQSHPHIVRLTNGGVPVDSSVFDPGLSFDATPLSVATQTVGNGTPAAPQFVVAGQFSSINGAVHNKLVRLNSDGSVDGSFNPSFDNRTTVVITQPDGKILVGGDFQNVNGQTANHLVRLNYDGSVDSTFVASVTGQPFGFIDPPAVYVIKLLADGGMYLGGNFTTVNGVTRNYLARVNADGTLDAAFDPGKVIINAVQSITIQPDGKLLVGETLSKKNGNNVQPPSLIRLYAEPSVLTLEAIKPTATEVPRKFGAFKLKRSGPVPNTDPLTVYLKLTAPENSEVYFQLANKLAYDKTTGLYAATFAPGTNNFKFAVNTTGLPLEGVSSVPVTVTVVPAPNGSSNYAAGATATVTITTE